MSVGSQCRVMNDTLFSMRITVQVTPKAKRVAIKQIDPQTYKVWVTAAPERGKATAQVLAVLAKHFDVASSTITIIAGAHTRRKLVEL